jgi:hypothetical protein
MTSLLFYFSSADLLSFSLLALILWEFFLRHSLDQASMLRFLWLFLMLLCKKTSSSSFWVSCGTHVMGYGSCCNDGYSLANGQVWWSIFFIWFLLWCYHWFCFVCVFSCLFHFWLWLQFCAKYISRASHQIGRIFLGILFLLIVNSTLRFIEENNASNAVAALMAHRAPKTKVCFQHLFDLCQSCCQGVVKWAEPSRHGGQSWLPLG